MRASRNPSSQDARAPERHGLVPDSMASVAAGACTYALVLALACGACASAGEESSTAKRSPVSPPPPSVDIPADLSIPVDIEGRAGEPITRARLLALAPDFADDGRRAWRLARVLGEVFAPGTVVEAVGERGVAIVMQRPATAEQPEPVLVLTRRGDLMAAMVSSNDPFPEYHGNGGRLRRPGDPLPRVLPVTRLRVRPQAGPGPAPGR